MVSCWCLHSDPNADAIAYVKAQGIVIGYPDGTYRPTLPINRAEFTKIMIKSNFTEQELDACDYHSRSFTFLDIDKNTWYAPYICLASQHKIVTGYDNLHFLPNVTINFAEAAKIIATIDSLHVNGDNTNASDLNGVLSSPYLQKSTDDTWYEPFVSYLADKNAIPTSVSHFDAPLTRGEMAEIIYRMKTQTTNKPSLTYEDIKNAGEGTMLVTMSLYDVKHRRYSYTSALLPKTSNILRASLEALFALNTPKGCDDSSCTMLNALYLSKLNVTSANIVDGVAHVKIEGDISLDGDMSGERAIQQIEHTIIQFPTVQSMDVTINGKPLKCLADLSGTCH